MHLLIPFLIALSMCICLSESSILTDALIRFINRRQSYWRAKRNFPKTTTFSKLKRLASLIGIHPDPHVNLIFENSTTDALSDIPNEFDSREAWPKCKSIKTIRDQGECGSCWAFAAAQIMSDRLCIFTNGRLQSHFSVQELISCCEDCGHGCNSGYLLPPYEYWETHGIPSESCSPYTDGISGITSSCSNNTCHSNYGKSYKKDKRHGIKAYRVTPDEKQMRAEIVKNGPIETMFQIYEDFYNYADGVYRHVSGESVGKHAVKIIGFGNENGTDYWLVANSWGADWGDFGGFFKIQRGTNECDVEKNVAAGIPNTNE